MTYEEAIENLKYIINNETVCHECPYEQALLSEEEQESCRIAIEALEKQIPKEAEIKPLYFENSKEPVEHLVHCPVCDSPVCFTTEYDVRENYKYCPRCGQRIEWEWEEPISIEQKRESLIEYCDSLDCINCPFPNVENIDCAFDEATRDQIEEWFEIMCRNLEVE